MTTTLPPTSGPQREEQPTARPEARAGRSNPFLRRGPLSTLALSLALLLLLYGLSLLFLRPSSPGRSVTLDSVYEAALERRVRSVTLLDEDARISGRMTPSNGGEEFRFFTSYPRSDALTNDLLKVFFNSGADVSVDSQAGKRLVRFVAQFLLPLVILANLFALLFYLTRSGGGGGTGEFQLFGRIGDKRLRQRGQTTFADVAASEEAVVELMEVRDYLADPTVFHAMGAFPPKGVLLVGPPGCGKTLLGRAVAGEAKASFYNVSGSEFVESLVGIGAARVRDLFAQARANAPSILFIDELDAVGRQRGAGLGGGHDEREQTLNELLVQMDGFSPTDGIVVMGATNRPDILDPALLRPGRFDRQVTVERPDLAGRLEILRLHGRGKRLADPASDLPAVAAATPGFSGADLANVLNESALLAVRERAGAIGRTHLDEAVERVLGGPRRRATLFSSPDRNRIAYHEAGHAVVAAAMGKAESFDKLSIISRGRGIGHLSLLAEDTQLPTRTDMESTITIAMAGIAAETLVLGEPSVGSEADLDRATTIARDMAGRYGMSDRLGRVRVLANHQEVFLGRDYLLTKEVSQPTLEHLDAEVRRILDAQETAAREILVAHRGVLDSLAGALTEHETLKGDDLRRALAGVSPYQPAEPAAAATNVPYGGQSDGGSQYGGGQYGGGQYGGGGSEG